MLFKIFPDLKDQNFKEMTYPNVFTFGYGGFLENRHGIDTGRHLGIDICVDSETNISIPSSCRVIDVYVDDNSPNGWGGRLIFKLDIPFDGSDYLIYGHLCPINLPNVGSKFNFGDIVGKVANIYESGSWFSHVHVQLITEKFFKFFENDLFNLDGYCHDLFEDVTELVSDPLNLIKN